MGSVHFIFAVTYKTMNARYRLTYRGVRGGMFYSFDKKLGKRFSLGTRDEAEAQQLIEAKNIAERQPTLNLQIAKAYIAGSDTGVKTRTWREAMEALTNTKHGANKERWQRVAKDKALALLLDKVVIETQGEQLLKVLQSGTVSTNVYLRRLHNFCLDMSWLPWPLIPKRQWPAVRFTATNGRLRSRNIPKSSPARRTLNAGRFINWHGTLGASQSDLAQPASRGRGLAEPHNQLLFG
jgi:hypothetical protein